MAERKRRQQQAAWYRSMGDAYAKYAEQASNPLAKAANLTEAAKYHSMADRVTTSPDSAREPQPGDGPDYHAEHAAWRNRKSHDAESGTDA